MSIVVYHNPDCETSRNVLAIIKASGYEPTVIEYLKTGWTKPQLLGLFAAADLTPRTALRESKSPARELGLLADGVSDDAIIDAMLQHPVLVNRPIVCTRKGGRCTARARCDSREEGAGISGLCSSQGKVRGRRQLETQGTEKEEQISSMQRQIEELRRKAEQRSQQLQGVAFEIELEAVLRSKFPRDIIEPVPKGEFGGDVLHSVGGPSGQVCGTILWESKRTKNWSDTWPSKLREDQRTAKAEIALIMYLPSYC